MFRCHVCGSTNAEHAHVNEIFHVDNKPVLVEGIPAAICRRCGERIFSRETMERVRKMVHESTEPSRRIALDVLTFDGEGAPEETILSG